MAEVVNTMADNDYEKWADRAIEKALVKMGIVISGMAIMRTPVDTGRLRGSITYATHRTRNRPQGRARGDDGVSNPITKWELYVGSNVDYAEYLEYGTYKTPKQPFLRPALKMARSRIQRIAKEMLGGILDGGK